MNSRLENPTQLPPEFATYIGVRSLRNQMTKNESGYYVKVLGDQTRFTLTEQGDQKILPDKKYDSLNQPTIHMFICRSDGDIAEVVFGTTGLVTLKIFDASSIPVEQLENMPVRAIQHATIVISTHDDSVREEIGGEMIRAAAPIFGMWLAASFQQNAFQPIPFPFNFRPKS